MKNLQGNMMGVVARTLFWLVVLIGFIIIFIWLLLKLPGVSKPAIASTPLLNPSPAVTSTVGPQLLHRDFEQPGGNLGYIDSGDWSRNVVDGNGLLEIHSSPSGGYGNLPSITYGSEAWSNYVFSFRFKVSVCDPKGFLGCMVIIAFRNEPGQAYVLMINTNSGEVILNFGGRDGWVAINKGITDTYLDLPLGTWHSVLLTANREVISASVDGKQTTLVSDDRLKTGAVAITVGAGATAQIDDINAWSISSVAP